MQAVREAWAVSFLVWVVQAAVAVFGVIKISESSHFGWVVLAIAALSGLLRIIGSLWEIRPFKFREPLRAWRRARLLKKEYAALAIQT